MKTIPIPRTKRLFDIVVGSVLLVVAAPVWLVIMLSMMLEWLLVPSSRGGFFYHEERISEGKPFRLYKFRIFTNKSLREARKEGSVIYTKKLEHDDRNLTYVGKAVKQIYMDELPQLWNILRGDMTLVGPRPTNPSLTALAVARGDTAKVRFRAGLTGYYQAHKDVPVEKSQDELDMEYITYVQHHPGWQVVVNDIRILLLTVLTVLRARGV